MRKEMMKMNKKVKELLRTIADTYDIEQNDEYIFIHPDTKIIVALKTNENYQAYEGQNTITITKGKSWIELLKKAPMFWMKL
jgi:hypothetical protein